MTFRATKSEITKIVNGKSEISPKEYVLEGVEFDSRNIRGGELFVALKGEIRHGHEYVNKAFDLGASLFLVESEEFLSGPYKDRVIVVKDTLKAFWDLAIYSRHQLKTPTIAVTGSVGKTTTKEILASLLVQVGPGNYAMKSFNNHIGVPYTILKCAPTHQWMVLELGMNSPGEIQELSKMAMPDVTIVTEVAAAHIGAFGTLEAIGKEKLSIVKGAKQGTYLIVNGDNLIIRNVIKSEKIDENYLVLNVCQDRSDGDLNISDITSVGMEKIEFNLNGNHNNLQINIHAELSIPGVHNARNAGIACLSAKALFPSISDEKLKKGLSQFIAPLMRLNLKTLPDGRQLLDDSYNANPASMKAMLDIAGNMKKQGNKIALILGDMLELGENSKNFHQELGSQISEIHPDYVVLVGEYAEDVAGRIVDSSKVLIANTPEDAAKAAVEYPVNMLFVKASRGIGLDRAVKLLVP